MKAVAEKDGRLLGVKVSNWVTVHYFYYETIEESSKQCDSVQLNPSQYFLGSGPMSGCTNPTLVIFFLFFFYVSLFY